MPLSAFSLMPALLARAILNTPPLFSRSDELNHLQDILHLAKNNR